jgi:hypothetical protein
MNTNCHLYDKSYLREINYKEILVESFFPVNSLAHMGKIILGLYREQDNIFLVYEDGNIEYNVTFSSKSDSSVTKNSIVRASHKAKSVQAKVSLPFSAA